MFGVGADLTSQCLQKLPVYFARSRLERDSAGWHTRQFQEHSSRSRVGSGRDRWRPAGLLELVAAAAEPRVAAFGGRGLAELVWAQARLRGRAPGALGRVHLEMRESSHLA